MRAFILTAAFLAQFAAGSADAREVKLAVPMNPPFASIEGAEVRGVVGEVFAKAARDLGWTVRAAGPVPFGRAYDDVHSGQADAAISVLATPDRRKLAHYSEPIATEYVAVVVAPGKAFKLESVADLAGKTIGTRVGFKYPLVDGAANVKFDPVADEVTNMRKLAAGRVDAIFVGSVTGLMQLDKAGFKGAYEVLPVAAGKVTVGSALADENFTPADLERLNGAIRQVIASSEWSAILGRTGVPELFKDFPLLRQ